MQHKLMKLPFSLDALEPVISSETIDYHYNKHHKGYVDKLNSLIKNTRFENMALDQILMETESGPIFNNAGQIWNHDFYWNCLANPNNSKMSRSLLKKLETQFGSVESFKKKLTSNAVSRFGSGYVWLVKDPDQDLKVISTANAENPMIHGQTPLLTIDVWEHAYYLDYRNAREKYMQMVWKIINWEFVENNLANAPKEIPALKRSSARSLQQPFSN